MVAQIKHWSRRVGVVMSLILILTVGFTAWNWKSVAAWRASKQLQSAETPEDRLTAARKLISCDQPGMDQLIFLAQQDNDNILTAIIESIRERSAEPQFSKIAQVLMSNPQGCRRVTLALMPEFLQLNDPAIREQCRETIKTSLAGDNANELVLAIPLAMDPKIGLRAAVVRSLNHTEPIIRRAAMIAVGPIGGTDALIDDESLFPWLNDSDFQVRQLCEVAMSARGLDFAQIEAARKLSHPEARERMQLLNELGWHTDGLTDPSPWLERLSRDANPAIRAGAARVACERRLHFARWVNNLALSDPDPLVRQIASFHSSQRDIQQTSGSD